MRAIARGRLAKARQIHLLDIQPGPGAFGALDLRALWPGRDFWPLEKTAAGRRRLDDNGAAGDDRSDAAAGLAHFLDQKRLSSAIALCGVGGGTRRAGREVLPSGADPLGDMALRALFTDRDWTDSIWDAFEPMVSEAMAQNPTALEDRVERSVGPPPALRAMLAGRRALRP